MENKGYRGELGSAETKSEAGAVVRMRNGQVVMGNNGKKSSWDEESGRK